MEYLLLLQTFKQFVSISSLSAYSRPMREGTPFVLIHLRNLVTVKLNILPKDIASKWWGQDSNRHFGSRTHILNCSREKYTLV